MRCEGSVQEHEHERLQMETMLEASSQGSMQFDELSSENFSEYDDIVKEHIIILEVNFEKVTSFCDFDFTIFIFYSKRIEECICL